jgi:hypothetical protein
MTSPHPAPAERLAELLDTLPAAERKQLTAWLFSRLSVRGTTLSWWPQAAQSLAGPGAAGALASGALPLRSLPAGEDSQLVTIRLPAGVHAQLREWCAGHGFTMAAVVRGLVERFLDQQERTATGD